MVRYLIATAGALAMMSSFAIAQVSVTDTGTSKIITRTAPDAMGHKTAIVKHRVDRYGNLVTKKKVIREGLSGSSVSRSRTTTDPMTGVTTKERSTEIR